MLNHLLDKRPGVLNILHFLRLAAPRTQTIAQELQCISRHAACRKSAVEIGTFQGVSAAVIADSMASHGRLYCVDPWPKVRDRENSAFKIARRHFSRNGLLSRIELVRQLSLHAAALIPAEIDFAFIDGDHSFDGLKFDWEMISPRLSHHAIVCLHDTSVPETDRNRTHGSVQYFNEFIIHDKRFLHLETVHSLNVLKRVAEC